MMRLMRDESANRTAAAAPLRALFFDDAAPIRTMLIAFAAVDPPDMSRANAMRALMPPRYLIARAVDVAANRAVAARSALSEERGRWSLNEERLRY